jgi:hypothetical protein
VCEEEAWHGGNGMSEAEARYRCGGTHKVEVWRDAGDDGVNEVEVWHGLGDDRMRQEEVKWIFS